MKDIVKVIETLRTQLERHKHSGLKEYPTRTIFIDPLLFALGWDVRDPDEVQLEYPTVDGKSARKKLQEIGVRSCNNTFYLIGCSHGETFTN